MKTNTTLTDKINRIVDLVCEEYFVTEEELRSKSRYKELVEARQMAMYIISRETGITLAEIGGVFDRDHATVIYAIKKVRQRAKHDQSVKFLITEITKEL